MKLNLSVLAVFISLQPGFTQFRCVKGDCKEGYGEAIFDSGARYAGNFLNGRAHGLGTMYFPEGHRYSGNWRNQYREGQGRFTFAGGGEYLGAFIQNQFEGKGVMTYANGDRYEGQWAANKPNGEGVLTTLAGTRYEGNFVNGAFEGDGIMWYADGSRYEGAWKKGLRDGVGSLFFTDGRLNQGIWIEDKYIGISLAAVEKERLTLKLDSSAYRNCNLEYCKTGLGEYSYPNGAYYIGEFINGIPEGNGRIFYPTGDRYEGGWKNHQPHGRGIMYYASGEVIGAVWDRGKPLEKTFVEPSRPIDDSKSDAQQLNPTSVRIRAVVVGIAQYTHMPALRYTDDDAYQMNAFLRSPQGGAVPESQIRLLIDEDASYKAILHALRTAASEADENDILLFYFSGHGVEGAFLPVDFDGYNNLMAHTTIRDIIQNSKARHKIVVADACHAGNLFAQRTPIHLIVEKFYTAFENSKGGMALLLSSKGTEYSLEDSGLRSGIYSHFLIKGARGPADRNSDGMVTVKEMHDYLYFNVRSYTANVQNPLLLGNFDPEMPFSVLR